MSIVTLPCCRRLEPTLHSTVFWLMFLSLGKEYTENICSDRIFIVIEIKMFHDALLMSLAIALPFFFQHGGLRILFLYLFFHSFATYKNMYSVHNIFHVIFFPLPFPSEYLSLLNNVSLMLPNNVSLSLPDLLFVSVLYTLHISA